MDKLVCNGSSDTWVSQDQHCTQCGRWSAEDSSLKQQKITSAAAEETELVAHCTR